MCARGFTDLPVALTANIVADDGSAGEESGAMHEQHKRSFQTQSRVVRLKAACVRP